MSSVWTWEAKPIARGEYVIAIEASHGADQAKTLVSFRVGSPSTQH